MKKGIVLILLGSAIAITCFAFANKKEAPPANSKGFAVVELFSSEGCSSCPPAEVVMHKLIQRAKSESLPIYVIEFHVDYWDYLGWTDTFATKEYTQRQQNYGDYFKLNSIYTPQAVINGKTEMLGSDDAKINSAINSELQNTSQAIIDCKANKTGSSVMEINYSITGNISQCEINFAVVESNLTTSVKKGENAGKTFTHDNVARVFKSIKLKSSAGKIILDVPHINLSNATLICYVQNKENMNITGATRVGIVQ